MDGSCFRWRGSCDRGGYGQIWINGKVRRTHHVAFAEANGITLADLADMVRGRPRMSVDHVAQRGCRFRDCWNPAHLELVSHRDNTLRGNTLPARQTAQVRCKRDHPLRGENLCPSGLAKGQRICLLCARAASRAGYYRGLGVDLTVDDLIAKVEAKYPHLLRA